MVLSNDAVQCEYVLGTTHQATSILVPQLDPILNLEIRVGHNGLYEVSKCRALLGIRVPALLNHLPHNQGLVLRKRRPIPVFGVIHHSEWTFPVQLFVVALKWTCFRKNFVLESKLK